MHESVTRTAEFISQSARGGLNRFGLEAAAHNSQNEITDQGNDFITKHRQQRNPVNDCSFYCPVKH